MAALNVVPARSKLSLGYVSLAAMPTREAFGIVAALRNRATLGRWQ